MTIQNPTHQVNSYTAQLTLQTLLDGYQDLISVGINCHHIGTIQTFNPANQTATATINYTKTSFQFDPTTNSNKPIQINYPILMMCPVICLGGSTTALTFPIQAGDECLILFNDRSIDNWFQSGQVQPLNSPRLHSISDGLILVGLRSSQNVLANFDTDHAVIRNNAGAQVGVHKTTAKVTVKNNSVSIKQVFNDLISAIESATFGGNTIDSTAALEAVRSEMEGLFE